MPADKTRKLEVVMKKTIAVFLTLLCLSALSGCGRTSDVKIDYGASAVYSKADMDAAIQIIKDEFGKWDGCELYSLCYISDDACSKSIGQMNDLRGSDSTGDPFTQCIVFASSFRSPKNGGGAWNPNRIYDWSWYLARTDGGAWELMTWGSG